MALVLTSTWPYNF